MPWQLISLIIGLVTMFLAKKSGSSTTEAAMLGLTAGGLTYAALGASDYAKTNVFTFSKDSSDPVDITELGILPTETTETDANGTVATKFTDGNYYTQTENGWVKVTKGTSVTVNADTNSTQTTTSDKWETAIKETGETLRSWGAIGTSAVIGTTKAVTSGGSTSTKWMLFALAAAGLVILLK